MKDYQRFDKKTRQEVIELIEKHGQKEDYESAQNDSPTVQELLDLADKYKTITYGGYIIFPPRDDYRVSIDGFSVTDLTADETLSLMQEYKHADDVDYIKDNDKYTFTAWWD